MKYGFVKVAAASPELRIAEPAFNAQKIIETIRSQAEKGTEILVFPELSLCGYTCGDLILNRKLTDGCLSALLKIAEATKEKKMLVFVGLPVVFESKTYNCAAALVNGRVAGIVPKTSLPTYGEFYEGRYFSAAPERGVMPVRLEEGVYAPFSRELLFRDAKHPDVTVACEICEDLWAADPPSARHAAAGATVVVNLSASNETVGKREYRKTLLAAQSGRCACAYLYADAGACESSSDLVFAGNHFVYENGVCLAEAKPFSGEVCEAEIDVEFLVGERRRMNTFVPVPQGGSPVQNAYTVCPCSFVGEGDLTLRDVSPAPFVPKEEGDLQARAEEILSMQANALARRLSHTGVKTAVIGVSGGLDSALALLVTARAFDLLKKDRKDILGYSMPGFGTTEGTKNNATLLMQALGVTAKTVPIANSVQEHFLDIGHDSDRLDTVYENAQARYRTMILMDVANATQGLVIGTGDLSELALGWCTYNGDHMSMYAVNASVPKTLVKHLVRAEANRLGRKIKGVLDKILETEISPELLPPDANGEIAQKTEDVVGKYEINDFYLYGFLRRGDSPAKALCLAERAFKGKYPREVLKNTLVNFYKRFFSQQFKRNCVPDGVKVGSVSLSPRGDWRMPSDASASLWIEEAENL